MAKENETVADIIAEKRRRAEAIERDCAEKMKRGDMVSDCYARELVADIRREADRLEAALRRERGDAAKLREALKKCLLYIASAESVGIGTITLNDKVKLYPKKIIKSAKEALAATKKEGGAK